MLISDSEGTSTGGADDEAEAGDVETLPPGEADVTATPIDEGNRAGDPLATSGTGVGTGRLDGGAETVPLSSGSGGRNSVRSRLRTSGAGSTARTPGRDAMPARVTGAARITAAKTQAHPARYAAASLAAVRAAFAYVRRSRCSRCPSPVSERSSRE